MYKLSVEKMGGMGALLVALCMVSFTLLVLTASQDALDVGAVSWSHVLADLALALLGLFGLAAIPAISAPVTPLSEGWMRWTSLLATVGFAVLSVTSFWQAEYELSLADTSFSMPTLTYDATPSAPASASTLAVAWNELLTRAPQGWLETTGVGLWMLSVSRLSRAQRLLPAGLIRLGLTAGALSLFTALGAVLNVTLFYLLGLLGSLALTPIWFAWMGVRLLRNEEPASPEDPPGEACPSPRPRARTRAHQVWTDRGAAALSHFWHARG